MDFRCRFSTKAFATTLTQVSVRLCRLNRICGLRIQWAARIQDSLPPPDVNTMATNMTQDHTASGDEKTFNLPPFPAFPSASRYVPTGSVDEAMVRVGRGIDASETIALVIGPPGTGKSLICQTLTRRYENSHDVVVLGNASINDGESLLRHILHCLGADHIAGPTNDLQLSLVDQVCGENASHGGLLIIVDEAQSISKEVLEAIRMTTNIMRDGQPRVSAVLCGGPKLDEVMADPSLEAFTQRIATRCYLHPFSADETREYITSVIAQCDADPDRTITLEAIRGGPSRLQRCASFGQPIDDSSDRCCRGIRAIDDRRYRGRPSLGDASAIAQSDDRRTETKRLPRTSNASASVEFGELSDWDSDDDRRSNLR